MKLTTVKEIYKNREAIPEQRGIRRRMGTKCTWIQGIWIYRTS